MKEITTNDTIPNYHPLYQAWTHLRLLLDALEAHEIVVQYSDCQFDIKKSTSAIEKIEEELRKYTITYYKENCSYIALLDVDAIYTEMREQEKREEKTIVEEFLAKYPFPKDYFNESELAEMNDKTPYGSNF